MSIKQSDFSLDLKLTTLNGKARKGGNETKQKSSTKEAESIIRSRNCQGNSKIHENKQ
jgi:hypothetical protein